MANAFRELITESPKVNLTDFPEDIQKLIGRLPIRTPKVIELTSTTAGVSVDINMLMIDDLEKIVKDGKKYKAHISNRNDKLMLLFTL